MVVIYMYPFRVIFIEQVFSLQNLDFKVVLEAS